MQITEENKCQMAHAAALIAVTQNQKSGEFHAELKHVRNVVHHFREEDYVIFKRGG